MLEAAPLPSPPGRYVELLRLLGASPGDGEAQARLLERAHALDAVAAGLADAPAADLALGSASLELAGLVGGAEPYYHLAGRHLSRAVEFDPGFPSYDLVVVRRGLDTEDWSPGPGLNRWDVLAEVLKAFPAATASGRAEGAPAAEAPDR